MAYSTRVFRFEDTWRKLGYLEYGDSREFRKILEANPDWDIEKIPAEGDLVFVDQQDFQQNLGKIESLDLTDFATGNSGLNLENYPWKNLNNLFQKLQEYTEYALENTDELNGSY